MNNNGAIEMGLITQEECAEQKEKRMTQSLDTGTEGRAKAAQKEKQERSHTLLIVI